MKSGFIVTGADPREAAELAAEAEAAGWDGVFTWDGVAIGDLDTYDPWIVMAAMAMRTERVQLGAIVTPPRSSGRSAGRRPRPGPGRSTIGAMGGARGARKKTLGDDREGSRSKSEANQARVRRAAKGQRHANLRGGS